MNKETEMTMTTNQTTVPSYNNCFTLGAKSKRDNGAIIKVPAFIDSDGYPAKLWGGKGGALSRYYSLSYDRAKNILERYLNGSKRVRCCFAHKLRKPFTQSAKKKKRLSGPFKTS